MTSPLTDADLAAMEARRAAPRSFARDCAAAGLCYARVAAAAVRPPREDLRRALKLLKSALHYDWWLDTYHSARAALPSDTRDLPTLEARAVLSAEFAIRALAETDESEAVISLRLARAQAQWAACAALGVEGSGHARVTAVRAYVDAAARVNAEEEYTWALTAEWDRVMPAILAEEGKR